MQVTFKLNAEQLVRANLVADCLAAFAEEKKNVPELRLCGNLNVQFDDDVYGWNPDQNLHLEGDRLTYKGQRHPLIQDGALGVIAVIAGYGDDDRPMREMVHATRSAENIGYRDDFSKLKIVSYQTSDARLYWFETVRSYLDNRGSWPEVVKAVRAGKYRLNVDCMERFPEKERLIRGLLSGDRNVHHEFALQEIKEAREIIKLCELELI